MLSSKERILSFGSVSQSVVPEQPCDRPFVVSLRNKVVWETPFRCASLTVSVFISHGRGMGAFLILIYIVNLTQEDGAYISQPYLTRESYFHGVS